MEREQAFHAGGTTVDGGARFGGEKTKDTLQVRGDARAATGANFATGRVMCKTGACGVQLHPGNSPKKLFCSPGYQDHCGPKWVENSMPNPQEPPCVPMVLPTVGSLDSPISGYPRNPCVVSCGDHARAFDTSIKSHFRKILSTFGNKCPQNGSKNEQTAPRTSMGYPHEGPSVAGPLSSEFSLNKRVRIKKSGLCLCHFQYKRFQNHSSRCSLFAPRRWRARI